jgi:hypothetical protein
MRWATRKCIVPLEITWPPAGNGEVDVKLTAFPLRPGGGGGHDYWSLVFREAGARAASLRGPLLLARPWSSSQPKFTLLHLSQQTLLGRTGACHPTHWVMVAVAIVGIP